VIRNGGRFASRFRGYPLYKKVEKKRSTAPQDSKTKMGSFYLKTWKMLKAEWLYLKLLLTEVTEKKLIASMKTARSTQNGLKSFSPTLVR
jgi:hypothetical protein